MSLRKKIAGLTGLTLSSALGITAMGITALSFSTGETFAQSNIDEIIVSARKRDESIQDVPIAVSALSPDQLERGAVQTVLDVQKLVPNIELHQVTQAGAALGASIRGMGFDDLEKTYEPTVGVSVDGVFLASNAGAVIDFFDIASIEVLRGPQGTLYGRNTIAGVINIKRSQPTGEWGGKFEATMAEHAREDFKGILNMPLGDKGGIKFSFRDLTQDSHLYNITRGETAQFRDSETGSVTVRYDFTDNTTATFTLDTYNHQTTPPDVINTSTADSLFCGIGLPALGVPADPQKCAAASGDISAANNYNISTASETIESFLQGNNSTLNVQHTGDGFTLKYIAGIMEFEEYAKFDSWGAPVTQNFVIRAQEYEQTSHEIQYISENDGPLNFVAGIYMLETEAFITSGPGTNFNNWQDAEAQAVFGEVIYEVNDLWTLTAGARYTEEDKELRAELYAAGPAGSTARQSYDVANASGGILTPTFSDDNLSYRLVAQRDLPFGMAYASLSTGFRSGGFNARGSDTATIGPYASEEVENIEFGLRTQPTDNLQLNFTVFQADYTDKQEFVVTAGDQCGILREGGTCTFIRNAAEVSYEGFEFEGVATPTDALTIRANLGYLDAGYDSYIYNGLGGTRDIASDAKVIYAPEITGGVTVEHSSDFSGGELTLSGSFSITDEMYGKASWESYSFATGPDITIDSHESLDLSATYIKETDSGNVLKLIVYGTDVLEEGNRVSRAFDAGAFAWSELVPRSQGGITLGREF